MPLWLSRCNINSYYLWQLSLCKEFNVKAITVPPQKEICPLHRLPKCLWNINSHPWSRLHPRNSPVPVPRSKIRWTLSDSGAKYSFSSSSSVYFAWAKSILSSSSSSIGRAYSTFCQQRQIRIISSNGGLAPFPVRSILPPILDNTLCNY